MLEVLFVLVYLFILILDVIFILLLPHLLFSMHETLNICYLCGVEISFKTFLAAAVLHDITVFEATIGLILWIALVNIL